MFISCVELEKMFDILNQDTRIIWLDEILCYLTLIYHFFTQRILISQRPDKLSISLDKVNVIF